MADEQNTTSEMAKQERKTLTPEQREHNRVRSKAYYASLSPERIRRNLDRAIELRKSRHIPKAPKPETLYHCKKCNRDLPKSAFYVSKSGRIRHPCRECHIADQRRLRKTPKDIAKRREYCKRLYANMTPEQRDKAREYNRKWRYNYNHTHGRKPLTPEQYAHAKKYAVAWRQRWLTTATPQEVATFRRQMSKLSLDALFRQYGLSRTKFEAMNAAQDGKCAICGGKSEPSKRLHIDHCHATKRVRGLLCGNCNMGLGSFRDNPDTLLKAIAYLTLDCEIA